MGWSATRAYSAISISFPIDNVHITVPKIGYKADLLKFCLRNAQERKPKMINVEQ